MPVSPSTTSEETQKIEGLGRNGETEEVVRGEETDNEIEDEDDEETGGRVPKGETIAEDADEGGESRTC